MFGFLKDKIRGFAGKVADVVKKKEVEDEKPAKKKEKPKKKAPKKKPEKKNIIEEEPLQEPVEDVPEVVEEPEVIEPEPEVVEEKRAPLVVEEPEKKKKGLGLFGKIKRAVVGEVQLSEKEVDDFLWDFELALMEGDVAHDVAKEICADIKKRLLERKFSKKENIEAVIEGVVKESIRDVLTSVDTIDFIKEVKKTKPCVIMFLGPNGAGKTTTIAKVASLLKKEGLSCIFAASDTFRAASIEQLQHHADALNIKMVKHSYGADPAAVAFDAIKSAKANNLDCVLIDTAGRQETNKNLMAELQKIARVCNPNLKVYLDEALAGNAMMDRIKDFKEHVGVDGLVLSKMDVDVKGGGTISVAHATKTPILYFGVGQGYDDIIPFSADEVLKRIFS